LRPNTLNLVNRDSLINWRNKLVVWGVRWCWVLWKKIKQWKGPGEGLRGEEFKIGWSGQVLSKLLIKRREPCGFLRKSVPGRGPCQCKGPEVGLCLAHLRNSEDSE
jgi:hypothetical protein